MTSKLLITGALTGLTLLSACGGLPDMRYNPRHDIAPPVAGVPPTAPAPSASAAEQACLAAGSAAGFDVQGVVGTREIVGAQGVITSRDVMLRVRRGGQTVDVRCNFAYDTGTARIMTL